LLYCDDVFAFLCCGLVVSWRRVRFFVLRFHCIMKLCSLFCVVVLCPNIVFA
jgi:hypothetical protein